LGFAFPEDPQDGEFGFGGPAPFGFHDRIMTKVFVIVKSFFRCFTANCKSGSGPIWALVGRAILPAAGFQPALAA
jgi:hypothetical protein